MSNEMIFTNLVPSIPDWRDLLYIPLTGTVAFYIG